MPDVGDSQIVELTVSPADGTTSATLAVIPPEGDVTTGLEPTPSNGNAVWSYEVTYTMPGIWQFMWTVTGTGRGVQYQKATVAPAPARGRSYASTTDLANWLKAAPPLNAQALLEGATRFLDNRVLLAAVYDINLDGMPTSTTVIKALRDATCALATWWHAQGIEGEDANSVYTTVSIGSASFTRTPGAGGAPSDPRMSREAAEILAGAGLLGHPIRSC
ncbi:hypothetical protein Ssi03_25860 [Sphaerisporangium siamense]|uniref:Uncharacterized protein n=1 Tax=Sphaerisporangium siamense TaxID=795645 RepID=A0A7W7G8A9_9ACTN|nr:hypothetical protein [Sphaerisporangium siamense]MBB4700087.1 hypothetical protein [Sphaerisporangium siamense]GII84596.1 hypothetical protein Ssi03_25860 [Sphaerisporangium siamense]